MKPTFPIRSISIIHPATFFPQNLLYFPSKKVKYSTQLGAIVEPLLQKLLNCFENIWSAISYVFWEEGNVSVLCCGAERIANEKYFLQQRGGWVVHSAQLTVSNSHSPLFRRILDHSHPVAGSKQDEGNPYLVCWSVVNHKKLNNRSLPGFNASSDLCQFLLFQGI